MEATERFVELMAAPEDEVDVDEVALLVAAHARNDLDLTTERRRIDVLAEGCATPTLEAMRSHLFGDLGFRGDRTNYYDPRNSYLDAVVRRRLGIPITLAALTIGVGRRLGVSLFGIGMPGHFLVAEGARPGRYVDVFDGGTTLDTQGCQLLFHALHGDAASFHPSYLQPVGAHAITARILNNLRSVFATRRDRRNLVWVLRLRSMVPGVSPDERGELADALAALGEFAAAARELEGLAGEQIDPDVSTALLRRADRFRSRLN